MKQHLTFLCALLLCACAPDPESLSGNQPAPATTEAAPAAPAEPSEPPPADPPADEPTPEPEPESGDPVTGIDVSHFQGTVDWAKVKAAGVAFAFAKSTEGVTYVDPQFASNWAGMKEAGIVRGAYAFYVAGDDPAKQAAHFLANTKLDSGDLPPVVDIETKGKSSEGDAPLAADLKTYLTALEKATGVKAIIYTSPGFWDAHFDDSFGSYPLWVAEYGVDEPKPVTGWDGWTFWQHTQGGAVDGVEGKVDQDTFAESLSSLKGLTLP